VTFLIYGASGYTGQLITERAHQLGLKPVLAGRNADKIKPLAEQYGFAYEVFNLENESVIDQMIQGFEVVLHCAGPFKFTAKPMMQACLRTATHYLDITGEIDIFEYGKYLGPKAEEAGIMLMPGVGFDVVPTDCLGLYLKKQLSDATQLSLGFAGLGPAGWSVGTASTAIVNLGKGSAHRKSGKIEAVPVGHKTRWISYKDKKLFFVSIPWGDVSTAFHTTGIPDIITYTGMKPAQYKWIKRQKYFNWLLAMPWVRKLALSRIKKGPAGPTAEERKATDTFVWGEVVNGKGQTKRASLITPNGYTLTAEASLIIVQNVMRGNFKTGFQTPASAYGEDLVLEVGGVNRKEESDF
jgi:short subunit dehydrogenase-like uncharacterized protein